MAELQLETLTKSFGPQVVVDHVDLQIPDGEMFVLLGPSGGGKTTILRLICGLERPDTGRIFIGDRDVTDLAPRERNIGMVFQEYGLYPSMNVAQNIAYGLEARGKVPKAEIRRRVADSAGELGLTPLLQRSPVDLSGGEQQRVALARAMVKDADVYLYDEPLSNLDPKLRYRARTDIAAVHRDKKKASLYITHDQIEAFALGDRVGVFAHGRLQQVGDLASLTENPANTFVAGFVGSPPMNLLPAALHRDQAALHAVAPGLSVALPDRWEQANPPAEVTVSIAPDAVIPSAHGELEGTIQTVERLIGETVVLIATQAGPVSALLTEGQENGLAGGQDRRFALDRRRLRLFDQATGLPQQLDQRKYLRVQTQV